MNLMSFVMKHPEADFVCFNCSYYYPDKSFARWKPYSDEILNSSDKNVIFRELVRSGTVPMSAWSKICRKEFLVNNGIEFKKGILSEDIPWFIDLMDKSEMCYFINEYIYSYRQSVSGSISSTMSAKNYEDIFGIIGNEIAKLEYRSFNDTTKKSIMSFLAYEYCILLSNVYRYLDKDDKIRQLQMYEWLLKYSENPKVRLAKSVDSIFGLHVTARILSIYQILRKSIKKKI